MTSFHFRAIAIVVTLALFAGMGIALKRAWTNEAVANFTAESFRVAANALEEIRQKQEKALQARELERTRLQGELVTLHDTISRLEAANAEVKKWSDTPLPNAVVEFLRHETGADAPTASLSTRDASDALSGTEVYREDERRFVAVGS